MNNDDITKILEIFKFDKNRLKNKNILISGGFGFIGKYLLDTLIAIQNNYRIKMNIYAVDNFITSNKIFIDKYQNKNINCIDHDINNYLNININFDYIICLAGIASPYYYNKYPIETLNVSINGLNNMFKLKHNKNSTYYTGITFSKRGKKGKRKMSMVDLCLSDLEKYEKRYKCIIEYEYQEEYGTMCFMLLKIRRIIRL